MPCDGAHADITGDYRGRHGAHTALGDNGKVCGGAEVDSARALGTVQDQTAATLGLGRVGQESCNHEANGECVLMETRHDLRERIGRVSRGDRDCTSHRQRGNSAGSGELIMSLFAKFTRFCLYHHFNKGMLTVRRCCGLKFFEVSYRSCRLLTRCICLYGAWLWHG